MGSAKRQPHILLIAKGFPPEIGGVETYSEQVALAYRALGCSVTVLSRFPRGGAPARWPVEGFSVVNVGASSFQPLVLARFVYHLIRLLAKHDFDIVHATTWRAYMAIVLLKIFRITVATWSVVTVHGREVMQTRGRLYRLMSYCFQNADKIVYISSFSKGVCEAYCPALLRKGIVAWNGISWPQALPKEDYSIDPRHVRLLSVSQLTKRKNVGSLIEVVERLNADGDLNVTLDVAGAGVEQAALAEQIRSHGLSDSVTLLGMVQRDALPELYRKADIFVHPHSHSHDRTDVETFCLAVADGMAIGVPTISGRDGAPSEYISDGQNGLLVDGADLDDLSRAIRGLIDGGPEHRAAIGAAGRAFALRNFRWERHVEAVLVAFGIRAEGKGDAPQLDEAVLADGEASKVRVH